MERMTKKLHIRQVDIEGTDHKALRIHTKDFLANDGYWAGPIQKQMLFTGEARRIAVNIINRHAGLIRMDFDYGYLQYVAGCTDNLLHALNLLAVINHVIDDEMYVKIMSEAEDMEKLKCVLATIIAEEKLSV